MATITKQLTIDRPVARVWDVWSNVRRLPELSRNTVAVLDAPDRLVERGQGFRQEVRWLGRSFRSAWTVTDIDPGHHLTVEGSLGFGTRYCITEQVEPLDGDRTRATLRVDYRLPLGPLGRVAARMGVEQAAEREAGEVLQGLKRTVEQAAPAS